MNKKLFLGMFAAAGMLFATSCSNDELEVVQSVDETQVTFSLGLEGGIGSRAISDGTGAKKLVYAVYKLDANNNPVLQKVVGSDENGQFVDNEAFDSGLTETVSITVAKGQTYQVAFWAQNPNCSAYTTTDLTNVGISYEKATNNNETRDAFFKTVEFEVSGNKTIDVELKRPFAQINVGVTSEDWNAAVASGIKIKESKVVIDNAATSINLLTGVVAGEETVTYALKEIPNELLKVDTDGDGVKEEYNWLSMSYILVNDPNNVDEDKDGTLGDNRATLNSLNFTFAPNSGNNIDFKEGLNSVPVQRNWRTNILGKILTGDIQFNITIDPAYDDDINVEDNWADGYSYDETTDTYHVYTTEGLEAVAALVAADDNGFAGKTISLENDIDLKGVTTMGNSFAPIGSTGERDSGNRLVCKPFKGTLDGQGHAIKNLYQSGWDMGYMWGQYGSIGLFAELEGATVKNVTIEGMDACVEGGDISFIAGSATGDCVFEDITIKKSSIGTYNNGCGGIIGWSGAGTYTFKNITLESDVVLGGLWGSFDSSIGGIVGQAEPGATYNFENVEINCRIDAYNDCTASYDYYNYRMCGMIIGRCAETTTINGANYPDLSKYNLSFNNVVVNYGDWMNYHYCRVSGQRAVRVEPGYAYDGIAADRDHSQDNVHCMEVIPFDQLIGGAQYAVKGLPAVDGVTVNYPVSFITNAIISDLSNVTSDKTVNLTSDLSVSSGNTIHTQNATADITINGNGNSIVSTASSADDFQWEGGTIPAMSTIFSSADGSKVTVNDLSFEGTMSALMLGHYQNATYNNYNTELNNVDVINTKVVSFSSGISPAVCIYGTAVLNNCNIYGTTLSELDTDPQWPVYDVAAVNYSTTTVNGGKIGSIYIWAHAKLTIADGTTVESITVRENMNATKYGLTIQAGASVGTIDLSAITNKAKVNITIEDGATVGKIVANGVEYDSIDAFKNS